MKRSQTERWEIEICETCLVVAVTGSTEDLSDEDFRKWYAGRESAWPEDWLILDAGRKFYGFKSTPCEGCEGLCGGVPGDRWSAVAEKF